MVGKGKMICKVNNFALYMEDYGQGPMFIAAISDENDDIIATAQLDITSAIFLERCMEAAISEVLGHAVRENWYGEKESK